MMGGTDESPPQGKIFFLPATLLYVTFSGLSENEITPWHPSALHLLYPVFKMSNWKWRYAEVKSRRRGVGPKIGIGMIHACGHYCSLDESPPQAKKIFWTS